MSSICLSVCLPVRVLVSLFVYSYRGMWNSMYWATTVSWPEQQGYCKTAWHVRSKLSLDSHFTECSNLHPLSMWSMYYACVALPSVYTFKVSNHPFPWVEMSYMYATAYQSHDHYVIGCQVSQWGWLWTRPMYVCTCAGYSHWVVVVNLMSSYELCVMGYNIANVLSYKQEWLSSRFCKHDIYVVPLYRCVICLLLPFSEAHVHLSES